MGVHYMLLGSSLVTRCDASVIVEVGSLESTTARIAGYCLERRAETLALGHNSTR